jgi:hypothetical protein
MITKNFRLNALANQYTQRHCTHITAISGGHFMIDAAASHTCGTAGGVKAPGLNDGYALEALKEHYPQWESVGSNTGKCVNADGLTDTGREIWQSMPPTWAQR